MSYIQNDFLLTNRRAQDLYNNYAKNMPIFDYHCHLKEREILEDKPFENLWEVWLKGDHYKWRLMRNYGIDEEWVTGSKSPKEKYLAYVKTLERAYGNPLYHWSAMELKYYLGCDLEINEKNAETIWKNANDFIRKNQLSPLKLISQSKVEFIFTTNEVFDDLSVFDEIKKKICSVTVCPAFRADKIMNIEADGYTEFIKMLEKVSCPIKDLDDMEQALELRMEEFVKHGAKASDIALEKVYPVVSKSEAQNVYKRILTGEKASEKDSEIFKGYLTYFLMKLYARFGIVTELHIGAMRNNNSQMLHMLGLDTGFDSISDENSIKNLSRLFDLLEKEKSLPSTIVFNLNPKMNTEILTLIGCFQDSSQKGKLQYGAAWWFLDHYNGMIRHLNDFCSLSHIDTFLGMLTDSRSFFSYVRHDYFRRILCNFLGEMMESGQIANDVENVGRTVQNISFLNCKKYFGYENI